LNVTDKVGALTALRVAADPEEEVLIITATGMVLRTTVGSISQIGRNTQGVIVMRIPADDKIIALAPVGLPIVHSDSLEQVDTPVDV
ncbi:MAG: DNA gyrase C-terminal beta-propeller domain-containing protein, partial [Candidatus Dormibacteraceae bacterium]